MDGFTVYRHIKNCNYIYAVATIFFIMLPSVPKGIDFIKKKITEIKSGELEWVSFLS